MAKQRCKSAKNIENNAIGQLKLFFVGAASKKGIFTMEKRLLDLEALLSLTEQFKTEMYSEDLAKWQEISAEVADIREEN